MDIKKNTALSGFPFLLLDAVDHQGATTWPTRGHLHLTLNGQTTAGIPPDASAATVETILAGLPCICLGNVSGRGGPLPQTPIEIEFVQTMGNRLVPLMVVSDELRGGVGTQVAITVVQPGCGPTSRVDQLTGNAMCTGGSFFLGVTIGGETQTTAAIAHDAMAEEVQSALQSLSSVGAGNVSVLPPITAERLAQGGTFTLQWCGALAGLNGPSNVSLDQGSLTDRYQLDSTPAVSGQNAIQRITVTHGEVSGYYMLDGGTPQALNGPFVEKGRGQWCTDLPAAATNGQLVSLLFVGPGVRPDHIALQTLGYDPAAAGMLVAGYAAGQSPADLVLAAPERRLATDAQGRVTVAALDPAERNALADALLARDVAGAEATAAGHSLCYVVLAMSEADRIAEAGRLTVYRSDGVTPFCRRTITTSVDASPITKVQQ